jgi:hypothetical protein
MVKSEGGQRESDGVVVPVIGVQHDAPGGRDPDFDHARGGGKRKGMTGTARSSYPGGTAPIDNVRRLQRKLWAAAKPSEGRRFHALFDRVHRGDVLVEAWKRVLANRGAAGVDRQSLEQVQDYGVDRRLRELSQDLSEGRYRHRKRSPRVPPDRLVRARPAAPPNDPQTRPQPSSGPDRHLDRTLVQHSRPAPIAWHHPVPEGGLTMHRRSSVSRMRESRTYRLKGGWGNSTALRSLRP